MNTKSCCKFATPSLRNPNIHRIGLFFAICLTGLVSSVSAAVFQYQAFLSGPNESPANGSPGTGSAEVDYDSVLHTLFVGVTWSGLTGTTTASHIHAATTTPFSGTAGVATTTPYFSGFPIGVSSGSYTNILDLTLASSYNPSYVTANGGTTASAEIALTSAIASGQAYLNIHSTTFGGGEIRGFLTPVPEPSCLAIVGLGGLLLCRRIRRHS